MPEKIKKTWTRVAFGDVVRQVRDHVDPDETGLERYVAGEHMDTDDLKIRRWGVLGDGYLGPAFHMRFKPGHILYGSRRTYLRKVAVADFEGITANTTFVLETKDPKVLLPELLPFIMQTEAFHEHSIKQSKGSVNPYINYSDLTWYEFALPPMDEQRQIAEALVLGHAHVESLRSALIKLLSLRRSMQNEMLFFPSDSDHDDSIVLADIALIGPSDPPLPTKAPFISMACVTEWERTITLFEERGDRNGVRAAAGDILMARITPCLENGKIAQVPAQIERCGGSTEFIVVRAKKNTNSSYLYWLLSSDRIRNMAVAMMSGSTGRQRVSGAHLGEIRITRIRPTEQVRLGKVIDIVESKRHRFLTRFKTALELQGMLINKLIRGDE